LHRRPAQSTQASTIQDKSEKIIVSQFRSSQTVAARSDANFEIKHQCERQSRCAPAPRKRGEVGPRRVAPLCANFTGMRISDVADLRVGGETGDWRHHGATGSFANPALSSARRTTPELFALAMKAVT